MTCSDLRSYNAQAPHHTRFSSSLATRLLADRPLRCSFPHARSVPSCSGCGNAVVASWESHERGDEKIPPTGRWRDASGLTRGTPVPPVPLAAATRPGRSERGSSAVANGSTLFRPSGNAASSRLSAVPLAIDAMGLCGADEGSGAGEDARGGYERRGWLEFNVLTRSGRVFFVFFAFFFSLFPALTFRSPAVLWRRKGRGFFFKLGFHRVFFFFFFSHLRLNLACVICRNKIMKKKSKGRAGINQSKEMIE